MMGKMLNTKDEKRLREIDSIFAGYEALQYVGKRVNAKYQLKHDSYLYFLYIKDHHGTNQDKIAEFMNVAKSTAGRVIDDLSEKDLLVRKQNPHNKRANNIYITNQGEKLINDICVFFNQWEEHTKSRP